MIYLIAAIELHAGKREAWCAAFKKVQPKLHTEAAVYQVFEPVS